VACTRDIVLAAPSVLKASPLAIIYKKNKWIPAITTSGELLQLLKMLWQKIGEFKAKLRQLIIN
jgi:hypothetical protein